MTLAARALAIGYRGTTVASGIDLTVEAGRLLCLLGPNGVGKTTLFRTLLGLLPARAGTVSIDGTPLAALRPRERARRIAYVPQLGNVDFAYTARDMVLMGRTAHLAAFARPSRADEAAAEAALGRVGMAALANRDYPTMSGGERQLVLIARALAQETGVLVMDEPTASLDFGNRARVLAMVAALRDHGQAIVMSTHDPDQALALADSVLVLYAGGLAAAGPPRDVLTADLLGRVYGTPVVIERTQSGGLVCRPRLGGITAAARTP